jgi:hypothetical protein
MARIAKAQIKEQGRQEARKKLLKILKPNDKVQCILRHVSRSGMMRHISLRAHNRDITWLAARAMNKKIHDNDGGIKVGGCGMDMGCHLVYNLGCTLWPAGPPKPHGTRNGEPDSNGGYALKQEWI